MDSHNSSNCIIIRTTAQPKVATLPVDMCTVILWQEGVKPPLNEGQFWPIRGSTKRIKKIGDCRCRIIKFIFVILFMLRLNFLSIHY